MVGTVEQPYEPTTIEEKLDRRGTLLMALSNKDQLKFHSYEDKKLLTLQKLISQLEIQVEVIEQEDINLKLLRRSSSTSQNPQNMDFVSSNNTNSTSNTNEADNTTYGVSIAHTQVENLIENALIAQDRIRGYDVSYQAEEKHPTNFALMALTSLGISSNSDSENLEKAEKEKDELKLTLKKYQNSYKSLNTLLESQVSDKDKTRLGYKAASPALENFVNSSKMIENQENVRSRSDKGYHAVPPHYIGNFIPPKPDLMFIDEQVESESVNVVSTVSSSDVKTVELKVESIDVKIRYDCDKRVVRPVWNNSRRVNHKNFANKITHPHPKRRFIPQAILTKSGKLKTVGTPVNTVRLVNTAYSKPIVNYSRPTSNAFEKGYSQAKRPFNKYSAYKKNIFNREVNVVKASDYDGGFVSFGDGKGRISRKGKIKTGILDFDDVYFCKELKYNLFNVSQMCDKKNNVLFTDIECLVLSSNFKLLDESQVLLRVPKKDNIYSVDLKSVVPTGSLTCLFAKATTDESNLWHRRLGDINFKTINKLVRGNLVRGLPSKIFENNHGCVAC
nr:putative ribonuclease H-like domain-containing protein [Tanacetum cinerariifolium]